MGLIQTVAKKDGALGVAGVLFQAFFGGSSKISKTYP